MRLRKKKNTDARFTAQQDLLLKEKDIAAWCDHPHLALEIGAGKGGFITEMARLHPGTRFIAVEKEKDCIIMAMEKAANAGVENLRFIAQDATLLRRMLPRGRFEIVYLNFSDPWPKKKFAKRRLTHRNMLRFFLPLIAPDGELRFKSDNDKLFAFTVEEFEDLGFETVFLTYDLHRENIPNVMTEYERRFSEAGVPIKSIRVRPNQTVFEKLAAYEAEKDPFSFHEILFCVDKAPKDSAPIGLFAALSSICFPFRVWTGDEALAADARALCESVNVPDLSPLDLPGEDAALVTDDRALADAAKAHGFFTIALGDFPADRKWKTLSKEEMFPIRR